MSVSTRPGATAGGARFEQMVGFLGGGGAAEVAHGELENRLATDGRELLRLLYQNPPGPPAARRVGLDIDLIAGEASWSTATPALLLNRRGGRLSDRSARA